MVEITDDLKQRIRQDFANRMRQGQLKSTISQGLAAPSSGIRTAAFQARLKGLQPPEPTTEEELRQTIKESEQKEAAKAKTAIKKGTISSLSNLGLVGGTAKDLSQVYADAVGEGGAGGIIQAGIGTAATKIGDLPKFLGGAEIGGKFPATGAFEGKKTEMLLKMMPMLTQQAMKPEGSVRVVSTIFEALGLTVPGRETAPKTAKRQITETVRSMFRFARAAETANLTLSDVFPNPDEAKVSDIRNWATQVADIASRIELSGEEESALNDLITKAISPIDKLIGVSGEVELSDDEAYQEYLKIVGGK